MSRTAFYWLASVALASVAVARADTLLIEGLDSANASAAERPGPGLTMSAVESRWGNPTGRQDAVGKPPIARWEYPDFVVYFEYDHVIHAVRRK